MLAAQPSVAPKQVVDTNDAAQIGYWANRLHISRDDLFAAIDKVGPSLGAIRRHLEK